MYFAVDIDTNHIMAVVFHPRKVQHTYPGAPTGHCSIDPKPLILPVRLIIHRVTL